MRPAIALDGETLRANARAYAELGAPVAAVVKSDGYGWGAERLARELDDVVESYVVADADELAALRPATGKPIRLLADAEPGQLSAVLALGGIPNVSTRGSLAAAAAEAERRGGLTVRVGIVDATGWSALAPADVGDFARALALTRLSVELWTHVTSRQRGDAICGAFDAARRVFLGAGVRVAGIDVASTAAATRATAHDRMRIGAGLFGARAGGEVRTRCALRVEAAVVRSVAAGTVNWSGYGDRSLCDVGPVVVLRCGYGDGLPTRLAGTADILSVGMQYTTRRVRAGSDPRVLIGADSDLDALAVAAGVLPQELITGLAPR